MLAIAIGWEALILGAGVFIDASIVVCFYSTNSRFGIARVLNTSIVRIGVTYDVFSWNTFALFTVPASSAEVSSTKRTVFIRIAA